MLDFFKDTLLPKLKLDAKSDKFSRQLNKKIVVRYQYETAAPHVEKQFKVFLKRNNSHNGGG